MNCYALISGYVGWDKQVRIEKALELWCKVVFYTISLTIIMAFIKPSHVYLDTVINAFVPVTSGQYWYITAYFGLLLLMPFLNLGISQFTKKQSLILLYCIIVLQVMIPVFLPEFSVNMENYGLKSGYSTLWLADLYLLGGICSKYSLLKSVSKKKGIAIALGMVLLALGFKAIVRSNYALFPETWVNENRLLQYGSPTMVLQAIMLLAIFEKIKVAGRVKEWIYVIAQASLGVYLLHEFSAVRNGFIAGSFEQLADGNALELLMGITICCVLIYAIGTCYDLLRAKLFLWLNIREKCIWVSRKAESIIQKCCL